MYTLQHVNTAKNHCPAYIYLNFAKFIDFRASGRLFKYHKGFQSCNNQYMKAVYFHVVYKLCM